MFSFTKLGGFNASSFQVIKDAMLQSDELPFAEFIDDDQWQAVFERHDIDFGNDEDCVYTPAITLWGLGHVNGTATVLNTVNSRFKKAF